MDSILVRGNGALSGHPIAGAKNACLTLMPATLLSEEPVTLTNAPRLSDISTMRSFAVLCGRDQRFEQRAGDCNVSHGLDNWRADYDIVRNARIKSGAWPAFGAIWSGDCLFTGGCAIGARPMDLHITALEALGAEIELKEGYLHAKAPLNGLKGGTHRLRFASVGATENFCWRLVWRRNFCS